MLSIICRTITVTTVGLVINDNS